MNKKILTPLFIAASFLLVGCSSDTIVARPTWIDEAIINGGDLKDNKMKEIYDAIKKLGDTNPSVLNNVMFKIAEKQIGKYTADKVEDRLSYFGTHGAASSEAAQEFVKNHQIYNSSEKGVGADKKVVELQSADRLKISRDLIAQRSEQINEDICEKLFNDIKGGSYSKDGIFIETKFINFLKKELYKVADVTTSDMSESIFRPKMYGETWRDYLSDFIYLNDLGDLDAPNLDLTKSKYYGDYIKRKILPELYRSYLVQLYVKEQRYSNLGRSYARKVNIVTIDADSDYKKGRVDSMLLYFAENYIAGSKKGSYNLEHLTQAIVGVAGANNPIAEELLTAGGFTKIKTNAGTSYDIQWPYDPDDATKKTPVYKGTKLGDLVEKCLKIYDISSTDGTDLKMQLKEKYDEATYNELTNSGAYSVSHGIELKEHELITTDLTQDGWFFKNGGLTEIDDTNRNRLFNIKVAQEIDETEITKDYTITFDGLASNKSLSFLTRKVIAGTPDYKKVVLHSDDNSKFYIIQIDEAASVSKMTYSVDNEGSYLYKKVKEGQDATYSTIEMNKIVNDIVKVTAEGDTYKQNAEQYYLMISNIVFYDQDVYDYFKSQFPDLFK